jgi:serine/threonine protein kinase
MMFTPHSAKSVDAAALAEELARCRVIPPERLKELLAEFSTGSAADLAEFLVARRVLTPFQAQRAIAGESRSLVLGPYRLTGFHGRGTLGPVLRAEKTGRAGTERYAIRVLPLRSLWQARQAKQLARSLATLPLHPAVAPLVDADSAAGFHYLVWPLWTGVVLADHVRTSGPIPATAAVTLLAQLASGLAACHERGVTCGLLTPFSVGMAPESGVTARLLDLGAGTLLALNLAAEESLLDTLSTAVAVADALMYLAPESIADPTHMTPAADQYALGAVGYFAVTGVAPTPGRPRPVAEANPAVPAELAATIDQLLQLNPADRYSGMDAVWELFAGLAGHEALIDLLCPPSGLAPPSHRDGVERVERSRADAISWVPGPELTRHPERDDSDDSIRFDLPDVPPEAEQAAAVIAPPSRDLVPSEPDVLTDTPRRPVAETQPSPPPSPRTSFEGTRAASELAPPAAEPQRHGKSKTRLLDSLDRRQDFAPPPQLPAAPLLPDPSSPHQGSVRRASDPIPRQAQHTHRPSAPPAATTGGAPQPPLWNSLRRKILFWQAPTDTVRVSVYGPAATARSEAPRLTIFLHPPAAVESVNTLARAFQHEAVLLGTGTLAQPLPRGVRLAVHLAVAHTVVTTPLGTFTWRGQPHRLTFDLVVPWEAPTGPVAGLVSVGKDDVRIGKMEFQLTIADRKG